MTERGRGAPQAGAPRQPRPAEREPQGMLSEFLLPVLRPAAASLSVLFGLLVIAHLVILPAPLDRILAAAALVTAALLGGLAIVLGRREVPPQRADGVGALIVGFVLANALLHLHLTGDPLQTTNVGLAVVGAGLLLLSVRWLLVLLVAAGVGWGAAVLRNGDAGLWTHFAFELAFLAVLSVLVFVSRRRVYRRLLLLRAEDARLKVGLEATAEEAQRREARFRTLVANLPGAVYRCEVAAPWRMEFLTEAVADLTGWRPADFEADRISWAGLIHPEDIGRGSRLLAEAVERHEPYEIEYRIRRRDESVAWVLERGRASYAPDGTPEHLDGVVFDITARKEAEEALANALREREAIMEAAPDLIYLLDTEGHLVRWNPEAERVTGYRGDEVQGWTALDFFPAKEAPRVLEAIERTLREGAGEVEASLVTKAGERRVIQFRSLVVRAPDGSIQGLAGVGRDVTRERAAQEALRDSEAKLRHILDHSTNLFYAHGPDHVLTYVSPQAREYLGVPPEVAARRWSEFLTDNPANQRGFEATERALQTGERQPPYELELVRRDGRTVWVEVNEAPVVEDGQVTGIVGALTDITARKEAEAAARKREAQLAEAQRLAHLGSWEWDVERNRITWSNALYEIFGLPPGSPIDYDTYLEMVVPEDREPFHTLVQESLRTGDPYHATHHVIRGDGERRMVEVRGKAERDAAGRVVGLVGTVHDITERAELEERLRESGRLLQEYIDSMTTFSAKLSPEGTILTLSRAAQMAAGVTAEETIGEFFAEARWFSFDPEVVARVRSAIEQARQGKAVRYQERVLSVRGIITIDFNLAPVADSEGHVRYIVAEGRDITDQKRAEAELRRSRDDLQDLAARLQHTNRELEAFSYSVSHDLRAPLRGIEYLSETLVEDYAHRLDDDGRGIIERLRTEAKRMSDLIEDLLNLSRITRGELRRETVDVSAMAASVVEQLRQRAPERRVDVEIEEGLTASADPRLLRVVLENLLGNAWKYTSKKPRARIQLGREDGDAGVSVFYVRDNGAGFDMARAGQLFTAFQRLHTASEFPGTGVGLATVRRIVERHGGRVSAEGVPGVGATFYFTLGPVRLPGAAVRPRASGA